MMIKKKKKILVSFAVLLFFAFAGGFFIALFIVKRFPQMRSFRPERTKKIPLTQQELNNNKQPEIDLVVGKEIPLPEGGKIGAYIQTQLIDLDGDEIKEGVALYHDKGDGDLYRVFFVIYKLKNNNWTKLIEKELEGFTLWEESPTEQGKLMDQFELAELTGDDIEDVLVKTKASGSGEFFGVFLYGLNQKGRLDLLFLQGPIPHGKAGVEEDRVWVMEPIYGPDDPNCCPSQWVKTWWQWEEGYFVQIGELKEVDFEKVKESSYFSIRE